MHVGCRLHGLNSISLNSRTLPESQGSGFDFRMGILAQMEIFNPYDSFTNQFDCVKIKEKFL